MAFFSNLEIYNSRKKIIISLIDLIGRLLFSPFFQKKVDKSSLVNVKRILLVRMDYIGDVIMTTAVLDPLRKAFPNAKISFLCGPWSKEILEGNPAIDELIVHEALWHSKRKRIDWLTEWRFSQELRKRKFDLVIEFRGDIRDILFYTFLPRIPVRVGYGRAGGGYLLTSEVPYNPDLHAIKKNLALLEHLKIPIDKAKVSVPFSEKDRQKALKLLKENDLGKGKYLIGIQTMARVGTREWLEDRFAKVADRCIQELGASIYFTGGPKDKDKVDRIRMLMKERAVSLAGKLSLKEEAALFKETDLVLSNETGIMHLASAMDVSLVALFGPQLPKRFGPFNKNSIVVWHNCGCWPSDQRQCHKPSCMELISVDEVFEAVKKMLSGEGIIKKQIPRNKQ